jgi:hypothetical protein
LKWRRRIVVGALALLQGCAAGDAPVAAGGAVTLVYSGNVDGEIEPCG